MKNRNSLPLIGGLMAIALTGAILGGCGDDKPAAKAPTKGIFDAQKETPKLETHSATVHNTPPPLESSGLAISDAIVKACGLSKPSSAPKFDFDSSQITDDDRQLLEELAKCLNTGPLSGKSLMMTGRADPRGESEYNMGLGANRASMVRKFLTNLNVAEARLWITSRGELDAKGTDEASWARDRRVDIDLR
jgi:peptidoglycan-associated lipoprotein